MTALEVMRAVAAALGAAGVEYMVVGSLSTSAYGVPRATKDADFVVQFGSSSVADVLRQLGPAFVLEPQMSFETITGTSRHRITHAESGFLIELFLLSDDAHDRERFARRRKVNYGGCDTFIASAEDVIITKLRWSRHGNRAKDIDDVRNVLAVRGDALDWDYVHRWCDDHGTRVLLDRVRAEAAGG